MLAQFQVLESFEYEINGSLNRYLEGSIYHVRDGNQQLLDLAEEWEKDGKVVVAYPDDQDPSKSGAASDASITGTGKVT